MTQFRGKMLQIAHNMAHVTLQFFSDVLVAVIICCISNWYCAYTELAILVHLLQETDILIHFLVSLVAN